MTPEPQDQARWFASEVQPHESALRAYLRGMTNGWHEVDDLVQESYIKLLRARARGAIGSVRGLLFTIARNAARDRFRRSAVSDTIYLEDVVASRVVDEEPGVAEQASRRQEEELLAEAIRSLPDRCRDVLTLRKFEGLSQKEVAARLGISEHTVEIHLLNALRRCRAALAKSGLRRGRSA